MLKWIYNLGVQHERMRIKKLIAEFHEQATRKYDEFNMMSDREKAKQRTRFDLDITREAGKVLDKLIEPGDAYPEVISRLTPPPIDEDK